MFEYEIKPSVFVMADTKAVRQLGAGHYEVTIWWPLPIPGRVNMLDATRCRLDGTVCRQVIGKQLSVNVPGGTTLVAEVLV